MTPSKKSPMHLLSSVLLVDRALLKEGLEEGWQRFGFKEKDFTKPTTRNSRLAVHVEKINAAVKVEIFGEGILPKCLPVDVGCSLSLGRVPKLNRRLSVLLKSPR